MPNSDPNLSFIDQNRALIAQVIRYAITGGFVTLIGAGVYRYLATNLGYAPLIANAAAYLVAVAIGYVLHSRYSFRGHGSRDNEAVTGSRFFVGSLVSWALNSLFVWIVTSVMALHPDWGLVPIIFITPVIMFVVNRRWVFQ
jgi:putative flippase GtrA